MRMRFKPYAHGELQDAPFYVEDTCALKGKWRQSFTKPANCLWLELGCGKGGFAAKLAANNQESNIIAIDITDKVLVLAKRNIEEEYKARQIDDYNIKIMSHDIERIYNMLDETDKINRIYINFCNPWDKKSGQKKHRLTYTKQLLKYRDILVDGGEIYFKCDHDGLFADSIEYFKEANYKIVWQTLNLHENEPEWNIRTEHEEMYASQGIPIKAIIAVKA